MQRSIASLLAVGAGKPARSAAGISRMPRTRTFASRRLLSSLLQPYGSKDDPCLRNHFQIVVHVVQAENVGQNADNQSPYDGARNRAAATHKAGTANYDCRNRLEFVRHSGIRIALVVLRGVQHPGVAG